MKNEKMRATFESWMGAGDGPTSWLDRDAYGEYKSDTAGMWDAWQGSSAASEKEIFHLTLEVRQLRATYDGANELIGVQAETIRRQTAAPAQFTWQPISTPPADARIVLLFCPDDEYPVWLGYLNGGWLHADGWDVAPTHWAEVPEGPKP